MYFFPISSSCNVKRKKNISYLISEDLKQYLTFVFFCAYLNSNFYACIWGLNLNHNILSLYRLNYLYIQIAISSPKFTFKSTARHWPGKRVSYHTKTSHQDPKVIPCLISPLLIGPSGINSVITFLFYPVLSNLKPSNSTIVTFLRYISFLHIFNCSSLLTEFYISGFFLISSWTFLLHLCRYLLAILISLKRPFCLYFF